MSLKYYVKRIKSIEFRRMNEVLNREAKRNNKSKISVKFDFLKCALKYKMGYVDYMKCNAVNLKDEDIKKLFTGENYKELLHYLNPIKYRVVMDDKIICNKIFSKYLKRSYIDLRVCSLDEFKEFLKGKENVFAKLVDGFGGAGVVKIKVNEIKDYKKLYNELCKNRQFLVEEEIKQHKTLTEINPAAVNNIRVVTLLKDNKVYYIERILRINDGLTDTISSHDIQGRLDEEFNLISDMVDDDLNIYKTHPVTGFKFEGIKIPNAKSVYELIERAAREIANIRFIGWDIAITPDGADIIEVNPYPCYTNYQYYLMHEANEKMNYYEKVINLLGDEIKK